MARTKATLAGKTTAINGKTAKPAAASAIPAPAAGTASSGAKKATSNASELVILTGLSGSGKASALKAFEDLGYYSVDNLPLELLPRFADLVRQSAEIDRAALVVDVREGQTLERFPAILQQIRTLTHDSRCEEQCTSPRAGTTRLLR